MNENEKRAWRLEESYYNKNPNVTSLILSMWLLELNLSNIQDTLKKSCFSFGLRHRRDKLIKKIKDISSTMLEIEECMSKQQFRPELTNTELNYYEKLFKEFFNDTNFSAQPFQQAKEMFNAEKKINEITKAFELLYEAV